MSDTNQAQPRVERLYFTVSAKGAIAFAKTHFDFDAGFGIAVDGPVAPTVVETNGFRVTLEHPKPLMNGIATVEMIRDVSTIDEARAIVEPYLQGWEIQALIDHVAKHNDTQRPLRFEYAGADVENPAEGNGLAILASPGTCFTYSSHMPAPTTFTTSPAVKAMWLRWLNYDEEREPLPSMAYYCLTKIDQLAGGNRRQAASISRIDFAVLSRLGKLVSVGGDDHERRKASAATQPPPYSAEERVWIERAVLSLIKRLGEVEFYRSQETPVSPLPLAPIKMANFPSLQVISYQDDSPTNA